MGKRRYRNSSDGNGFLCAPASEYVQGGPKFNKCPEPLDTYAWDKKSVDFQIAATKKK